MNPKKNFKWTRFFMIQCLSFAFCLQLQAAEKNLVYHLPFDGNTEPTVGKKVGTPKVHGKPAFVEGKHGKAISLTEGLNMVMKLPPEIKKGEFTIAFWMKPLWHPEDDMPHPVLEIPDDPKAYDKVKWAPGQFLFSKGWSETISPNHLYGVVDANSAALHLKPGQWTHYVVSFSEKGKFRASYVNGEGIRRPAKKATPTAHGNVMWIGSRANGKGVADVVIDDLKIYDKIVNPEEIESVAGTKFPPRPNHLLLGNTCEPEKAVETPHKKIAKPYAGGKLRIICVSSGQRARGFLELAQRVDIEPLIVTCPRINSFSLANKETFQEVGEKVEKYLKQGNIDSIIISSFGWNLFSESVRKTIMNYVEQGGGLMFVNPHCVSKAPTSGIYMNAGSGLWLGWKDTKEGQEIEKLVHRLDRTEEEYITKTIPWEKNSLFESQLDHRAPTTLLRGAKYGKGRILIYDINTGSSSSQASLVPMTTYTTTFNPFDYHYALSVAAKALLWTTHKDSKIRIQDISYGSNRFFFRRVTVGMRGEWEIKILNQTGKAVKIQLKLDAHTREPEIPFKSAKNVNLKPGLNTVTIPHTMDRIGHVFADVSILINKKVADWTTTTIKVEHGNPWFSTVKANKLAYQPGEKPRIDAEVALKTYGKSLGQTGAIQWELFDAYDRMIAKGKENFVFNPYDQYTENVAWILPPLDNSSLYYKLIVNLERNKKITDQKVLELKCLKQKNDDFIFYVWGGSGHNIVDSLGAILMRDNYGLDCVGTTCMGGPVGQKYIDSLNWVNRINLRPWVYATHLGGYFDKENMRDLDMSDPDHLQNLSERLEYIASITEPYSPLFYSLGDEVKQGPPNATASGYEQQAFRNHLKVKFRKIGALNKKWGTEYKFWRDIVIPTTEEFAQNKCNPHLWNELKSFRDTLFADMVKAAVKGTRKVAPDAKVGTEGIFGLTSAWGNFDYSKLTQTSTFMGQYALGMQADMVRSLQKPGDLLGCWYNYTKLNPEYSRYGPWHTLLNGVKAFGWYTIIEGSWYNALNSDFSLFPNFAWTWEELKPILSGIGKLVLGLKRDNPGVYVLYEHRNLNRHSPSFLSMILMTTMLNDLGIQHDFIASQKIAQGGLNNPAIKVLVLPRPFVIEQPVADAIKAFTKNGGIVISDYDVAASDGYTRYKVRPLDEIFADKKTIKGKPLPKTETDLKDWKTHEKTYGKGATLLFNGSIKDYRKKRMKQPGQLMRTALSRFLAAHNIKPVFKVQAADKPFLPVKVVCYKDNKNRYVAMQREYKILDQAPGKFEVTGPAKAHIYDVLKGKYLGHSEKTAITLEVARGAMLAFLPYKATGLKISGLPSTIHQGDTVNLQLILETESGSPSGGVFRVETLDTEGKKVFPLCKKIRSTGGISDLTLQFAFNDPVGDWKLKVTDIATGTTKEITFKVLSANVSTGK